MNANLLLENPEFKVTETAHGVWREFLYSSGQVYREFSSHRKVGALPWVQIKWGVNPETGCKESARGFIAIGQFARGTVAIGQVARGTIAIGQCAVGKVFALGQLSVAPLSIGQLGLGVLTIQQIGAAYAGIFQMGVAQMGRAQHLVSWWPW